MGRRVRRRGWGGEGEASDDSGKCYNVIRRTQDELEFSIGAPKKAYFPKGGRNPRRFGFVPSNICISCRGGGQSRVPMTLPEKWYKITLKASKYAKALHFPSTRSPSLSYAQEKLVFPLSRPFPPARLGKNSLFFSLTRPTLTENRSSETNAFVTRKIYGKRFSSSR